jgi:L-seryl-tRNA(Ser) seleniumtransferase
LEDYQKAITKNTGAILVAHTSNYKVLGFTQSVELTELSALAKKNRIPLILDLGSGAIADFQKLGLPHEPMVRTYLQSGASVISFSGDKLLGGPQSGIICGKKSLIQKIHNNPMYRALRCDKLTYAILEGTLRSYYTPSDIHSQNLTMALFFRKQEELETLGMNILKKLPKKIVENYGIEVIPTDVEAGSGSLPLEKFPSTALVFSGKKASALAQVFRKSDPPILGYITGKQFHIDLKAIPDDMISVLTDTIVKTLK